MMQIDTALVTIVIEALIALSLIVIATFLFSLKRKRRDREAAGSLINKVTKGSSLREKELQDLFGYDSDGDDELFGSVVKEIQEIEKRLYQHVVQLFLQRDVQMFSKIDQQLQSLSAPYSRLVEEKQVEGEVNPGNVEEIEQLKAEQARLQEDNDRLTEQLGVAMDTMNEVSTEYSNMFGGSKAVEELNASKEKMLKTYRQATEQFSQTIERPEENEISKDEVSLFE